MENEATLPVITHISEVQIDGLWGHEDLNVRWKLYPDVNILAGENGSGKSTVLRLINLAWANILKTADFAKEIIISSNLDHKKSIKFYEFDGKFKPIGVFTQGVIFSEEYEARKNETLTNLLDAYYLATFDQPLKSIEAVQKLSDDRVKTDLDWQLHEWQQLYKDYQINIGKRAIEALQAGKNGVESINAKRDLFFDLIDEHFEATQKRIDRSQNDLAFIGRKNTRISLYELSSGEKQLVLMLFMALVQDNKPCVMIMDEPEISLHTYWQEDLIDNIRRLNPNAQLIIATHSPAMILNGWKNNVSVMSDILKEG